MSKSDPRLELVEYTLSHGGDAGEVVDALERAGFLVSKNQSKTPVTLDFPPEYSVHQVEKLVKEMSRQIYWLQKSGLRVQTRHKGQRREFNG